MAFKVFADLTENLRIDSVQMFDDYYLSHFQRFDAPYNRTIVSTIFVRVCLLSWSISFALCRTLQRAISAKKYLN